MGRYIGYGGGGGEGRWGRCFFCVVCVLLFFCIENAFFFIRIIDRMEVISTLCYFNENYLYYYVIN